MQDQLPALIESDPTPVKAALVPPRMERRWAIAALHRAGLPHRIITAFTQAHPSTVHRWTGRLKEGHAITDLPRCGRPRTYGEASRLTTIAVYCQQAPPLPGVHHWSLRDAERHFRRHPQAAGGSMSRSTIQRILCEHSLRPHRHRYYLQITDPDFFPKMEPIVDLYLHPPPNLYCFDECTCIQALKRLTPDLPPRAGQPLLEDFDYQRNGTTDLLAFLNPATGRVYGRCTADHNRHTLSRVFTAHVQTHPSDAVIHYIMDNLSPHCHDDFCRRVAELSAVKYPTLENSAQRRQWLQSEDKRIVVHFLPFHASWLNLIEIWFGILKSKCLQYDHFDSVDQLQTSISAFIETWNRCFAHPFKWSYTGEGLHARAVRRFCRLLTIETDQMDSKFLKSQLLLMSNIAAGYLKRVPHADWMKLLELAAQKQSYICGIIEKETGPRRRQSAQEAYQQFVNTVVNRKEPLALAG